MLAEIVKQALLHTVTDIGQLTSTEKLSLKKAVRSGWLVAGQGGPYPRLKTVYAHPGFNFKEDRERQLRALFIIGDHIADDVRVS